MSSQFPIGLPMKVAGLVEGKEALFVTTTFHTVLEITLSALSSAVVITRDTAGYAGPQNELFEIVWASLELLKKENLGFLGVCLITRPVWSQP